MAYLIIKAIYKAWPVPANKPNFADKTAALTHWPVNCSCFKNKTMIFVTDKAKEKVANLMQQANVVGDNSYFLRVSVVGGGCSGLSYKLDFDNESKPNDQVFEDNGVKVVTDMKSFLYLYNTTLDFSDGLNGKGFHFNNPNASRTCGCGESFAV
ncbi:MAG TPA: iron-sulfur cluster assembly accessory protein [Niabella sp.]|nr:iron-sulfur cluster assembly accessory protein [Niabella sp.]